MASIPTPEWWTFARSFGQLSLRVRRPPPHWHTLSFMGRTAGYWTNPEVFSESHSRDHLKPGAHRALSIVHCLRVVISAQLSPSRRLAILASGDLNRPDQIRHC